MDKDPTEIKIKALVKLRAIKDGHKSIIHIGQIVWMPVEVARDLIGKELAVEVDRR